MNGEKICSICNQGGGHFINIEGCEHSFHALCIDKIHPALCPSCPPSNDRRFYLSHIVRDVIKEFNRDIKISYPKNDFNSINIGYEEYMYIPLADIVRSYITKYIHWNNLCFSYEKCSIKRGHRMFLNVKFLSPVHVDLADFIAKFNAVDGSYRIGWCRVDCLGDVKGITRFFGKTGFIIQEGSEFQSLDIKNLNSKKCSMMYEGEYRLDFTF